MRVTFVLFAQQYSEQTPISQGNGCWVSQGRVGINCPTSVEQSEEGTNPFYRVRILLVLHILPSLIVPQQVVFLGWWGLGWGL